MPATAPDLETTNNALLQALNSLLREDDAHRVVLSQQLHKEVAGGLVAGASMGEMIRHELARGGDAARVGGLLATLESTLRQTLQIVREMTEDLFPPVLKAFGLNVALQQLVRGLAEGFAGSLVLHLSGDEPSLDLVRRLSMFRVIQSLLKHCVLSANTSWVEVTCHASADRVEITIDHDGSDAMLMEHFADMAVVEARCVSLGSRMQVMRVGPGSCSRFKVTTLSSAQTG